jgi:hypothetical protein
MKVRPGLYVERFLDRGGQLFSGPRSADEQLLAGTAAERDGLPTVLRRYRDPDLDLAFRVAYRSDHPRNDRADLWGRGEQAFEHLLYPVNNTVLDFELSLRFPCALGEGFNA